MSTDAGDGWVSEFDTPTDERTLWGAANLQEVLPGLVTPLSWSLQRPSMKRAFNWNFQRFGILRPDEDMDFIGCFYSRVFGNITAFRTVAERSLLTSGDALEEQYLGLSRGAISERPPVEDRLGATWRMILRLPSSLRLVLALPVQTDRYWVDVLESEAWLRSTDWRSLSDPDLDAVRRSLKPLADDAVTHHIVTTGVASALFEQVSGIVQRLLPGQASELTPALFAGLRSIESADIAMDLWRLSRLALNEPEVETALRSSPEAAAGLAQGTGHFASALRAFSERHGHRGIAEMEVSAPSWRQDPSPVLTTVASYLDTAETESPPARLARGEESRLAAEEQFFAASPAMMRPPIRGLLRKARQFVSLRERTKSVAVRGVRRGEFPLAEIQHRLLERGDIEDKDDVFFLTDDELSRRLTGALDRQELAALVERRRAEHERNRGVVLPDRFYGRPRPVQTRDLPPAGRVLTGIPVMTGRASGPARVITDPRGATLQPGEVLVAPVTDAGWTPLFANAAALVVDTGGPLSHGSTVAREYGIPAVVAVKDASKTVRDGQRLTVDGKAGTVTLED